MAFPSVLLPFPPFWTTMSLDSPLLPHKKTYAQLLHWASLPLLNNPRESSEEATNLILPLFPNSVKSFWLVILRQGLTQ